MSENQDIEKTTGTLVDPDMATEEFAILPPKRSRIRHYWPHLVAFVALCALSAVSYLFWSEVNKRFPLLANGNYLGALDGEVLNEPGRSIPLYVGKEIDTEDLVFLLFKSDWLPQTLLPVAVTSGTEKSVSVLPVVLTGSGAKLEFQGILLPNGEYQGEVVNLVNKKRGRWWVRQMPEESVEEKAPATDRDLRVKLLLRAELSSIDEKIAEDEKLLPERQAEIENLTKVVIEGERLKVKANEKYGQSVAELQRLKQNLKERQEQARRVEAAVKVAQRVTSSGKLVSLARESLERDWRFADSMLRAEANEGSAELDAAYERGQSILRIKEEIELEERRIEDLLGSSAGAAVEDAETLAVIGYE